MESSVLACAAPGAAVGGGGAGDMVRLKRSALVACLTCPLCGRLLRDAATITECLHTFCRKCISEEFINKEVCCCPICSIDLGSAPLEKLRIDHRIQYVRSKIFPKKQKDEALEFTSPITSPTKRKERSLSSLPIHAPQVSMQKCLTNHEIVLTPGSESQPLCQAAGIDPAPPGPMQQAEDTKRLHAAEKQPEQSRPPLKRRCLIAPGAGGGEGLLVVALRKTIALQQAQRTPTEAALGATTTPVAIPTAATPTAGHAEEQAEVTTGGMARASSPVAASVAATARLGSPPPQVASVRPLADAVWGVTPVSMRGGPQLLWVKSQNPDATVFALDAAAIFQEWQHSHDNLTAVKSTLLDVVKPGIQFLKERSAEEARMRRELAEQLTAARREVAELRDRELTVCEDARNAQDKLQAVLERSRTDDVAWKQERDRLQEERDRMQEELDRLQGERDQLAKSVGRLPEALSLARQVCTDAIVLTTERGKEVQAAEAAMAALRTTVYKERDLKETAEGMSADLALKLSQSKVAITKLQGEVKALNDKVVKSRGLEKDLCELRRVFQQQRDDHKTLRVAVQVALNDLGMTQQHESSSLAARVPHIVARARRIAMDALYIGVHQSFAIARSHYGETINFELMSKGYAAGCTEAEMVEFEEQVAPLARALAAEYEEWVVPRRSR